MKQILLYSLVVVLFLLGCSPQEQKTQGATVVIVDPDMPMMTSEEMAQHFTNDRMVILRGTILGDIERLIDWNGRLVVFDRRGQQVVFFDTIGNCISKIKRLGKGPGEYIHLEDCTIDNAKDELILYADQPGKLIWFDREGNYLREEHVSDCFREVVCYGDNLYGVNCGFGRTMAENTITRMMSNDIVNTELQVPLKKRSPNVSAGSWLTTNGTNLWLSRPLDYTLYFLDPETGQLLPRYQLDLGKATVPENETNLEIDLQKLTQAGFVFHVSEVGVVGKYLFFSTVLDEYMMDTATGQLAKMGKVQLFDSSEYSITTYRLLTNQDKRIVRVVAVMRLQMWSEEMKNKGQKNAELEKVMAANEEFMNPVLLFQDVR